LPQLTAFSDRRDFGKESTAATERLLKLPRLANSWIIVNAFADEASSAVKIGRPLPEKLLSPGCCETILLVAVLALGSPHTLRAEETDPAFDRQFEWGVVPFLNRHCLSCHGEKKPAAMLDLTGRRTIENVARDHRVWESIAERLEAGEMPPEDAQTRPTPEERKVVLDWLKAWQDREARRNAGDPGLVLARRLSNAEYDYTIHDLTGVDIRPTREFPVDPANEAGFDNSGESLTVSPALLKKSLAAARHVADHLVLKPDGLVFAPHPVVTDTDRDKYCVHRIVDFYRRHEVDSADYFLAAWQFEQRAALGRPEITLAAIAAEAKLSPRYLATVHEALTGAATGPLGKIIAAWRKLPAAEAPFVDVRRGCVELGELVKSAREPLERKINRLSSDGISQGSQPLILWWNRQVAKSRMECQTSRQGDEARDDERFCRVFPSAFFVVDRGPYFDPKGAGQGRLLTAGFHLMQGYFRDDQPLCELVLDDSEKKELDSLWSELNFVTQVPARQYKDFIFFERAEPPRFMQGAAFDFARSEDKDSSSTEKIRQLAIAYRARAEELRVGDKLLEAIDEYFQRISQQIQQVDQGRLSAEPRHLEALLQFAERACRRPLEPGERAELLAFYKALRETEGLNHEEAIRDSVASILVSPHFCFRTQIAGAGPGAQPLSSSELASRLSYFLWSSMPDAELLAHARAGDLTQKEVLIAQTRRMMQDERCRHLAVEFATNWLELRRFEEHNAVDRERFPGFTNDLRQAMFEEPIRFFSDLVRRNGSILECTQGRHTFVNAILAKHYGMPFGSDTPDEWVRVDNASQFGRGGLLPMAAFLTKNAPGLRTSPVKRGYWVVRRLLGEHIPPPPPEVPELPKDESQLGELTLPQVLARHREHKACAGCHQRFDSVGLAFEGYGPIGERRELDLGGHPVQTQGTFPDGSERTGLDGLREYLADCRQNDFIDNISRKMMIYALGRSLIPSDKMTLDEIKTRLATDNYQIGTLIESIVTSPQFLNKRGRDDPRE